MKRRRDYRIPESFSAFCRIVSFTAANTNRIFDVSVACVRLDDRDQNARSRTETRLRRTGGTRSGAPGSPA